MKVIILGDGLLGTEIRNQTKWNFISRKSHGFNFVPDLDLYLKYIKDNEYDVVLNCIANTDTYGGFEYEHKTINADRVKDLVNFCNQENKKLVHISTDYLYSNSISNAKETDDIKPLNTLYGQFKNIGDMYVETGCKNFLLIRTSFKPNPFPYSKAVPQIGNFDYVNIISKLIIKLIKKNAKGTFNVGTERKTMLELAKRTNPDVVLGEINNPKMPVDVSMDISKMKKVLNIK